MLTRELKIEGCHSVGAAFDKAVEEVRCWRYQGGLEGPIRDKVVSFKAKLLFAEMDFLPAGGYGYEDDAPTFVFEITGTLKEDL